MTEKKVRIHRATSDDKNFSSPRATAQDRTMSFTARGMLFYLLSKPGDWELQPSDLQQEGCGKNQVYRVLSELILHKYIDRVYNRDDKGRVLSVEYEVFAAPVIKPSSPLPQNQEMGNPEMDNRDITVNTESTGNTDKTTRESPKNLVQDDIREIKAEEEREWMFEAVAWGWFCLDREALRTVNPKVRGYIGIIVKGENKTKNGKRKSLEELDYGLMGCFFQDENGLYRKPSKAEEKAKAHEVLLFAADWRKNKPGIDLPGSSSKIFLRFNEWAQSRIANATENYWMPDPDRPGVFQRNLS